MKGSVRTTYSLPRPTFEVDAFSMWQYLEAHGAAAAVQGTFAGAAIDQAHRHGVKVLANHFTNWDVPLKRGEENNYSSIFWTRLAEKNDKGEFLYVDHMLDFFQHYGYDGMAFNMEGKDMNKHPGWAADIQDFFVELHKKAKNRGMDILTFWYDAQSNEGQLSFRQLQLDATNDKWFDKGGTVMNGVFLSYDWSDSRLRNSVATAEGFGRSSYDVYAGMLLGDKGLWGGISRRGRPNPTIGWHDIAKHPVSISWWGGHHYNNVYGTHVRKGSGSDLEKQNRYQHLLEQIYSGGNRNPSDTPPVNNTATISEADPFHGVARFITAKSTLSSLPFTTRFSLGNGLKFYDGGEVTHDNEWSNIGVQDYMPTWRWWISGNTDLRAAFTYDEAYSGGSCLKLSGSVSRERADVHLYKTAFALSGRPSAEVKFKLPGVAAGSDAGLSLALAFSD
ncbi:MAG: hypothetical protein GDA37_13535, partial [Ekhidna sp.]|nr:hypothetical protein [Ekhidna sp.]